MKNIIEYIKKLISIEDPAQAHIAITIMVAMIMAILVIFVGVSCVFVAKSLTAELGILVGALTGITGYTTKKNLESNNKE